MYGLFRSPLAGGGGGGLSYNGPFTLAGGELTFGASGLSGVSRLTVCLYNIAHPTTNHNAAPVLQLGAGGAIATTGYRTIGCWYDSTNGNFFTDTNFFRTTSAWGAELFSAICIFIHLGGNVWGGMMNGTDDTPGRVFQFAGVVALGGTLTDFQVNTVNGTEGFSAGGQWSYYLE